jgi:hypothetical protein
MMARLSLALGGGGFLFYRVIVSISCTSASRSSGDSRSTMLRASGDLGTDQGEFVVNFRKIYCMRCV